MNGTQADYQLLAVFVAVAEESSFSGAARKLGIGKGSVSRAIARLEAQLGAELLHRNTHAVALSTAGAALYERTAHHLAALDEAVLRLPERAEQPSGEIRLTAPHDFGIIVLPELLSQFSLRHPAIRFDLRLTNRTVDLVAEGFDLAIRAGTTKLKDSSLTVRRLGSTGSGFYASPAYVARRGKPRTLSETRHDWILHPALRSHWKLRRAQTSRWLCDDFSMVRELVREGAGVGFLPSFVAEPYVRAGYIEALAIDDLPRVSATFALLYPSSGQVPRKITAFRDFLLERLKKSPLG